MHNRYGVLICLQGMDTSSGKIDSEFLRSLIKVGVYSFKTPTELEHDYLWRHYLALPESLLCLIELTMRMC
jgi:polyphosphate kinase 2 (PPK2 family)